MGGSVLVHFGLETQRLSRIALQRPTLIWLRATIRHARLVPCPWPTSWTHKRRRYLEHVTGADGRDDFTKLDPAEFPDARNQLELLDRLFPRKTTVGAPNQRQRFVELFPALAQALAQAPA